MVKIVRRLLNRKQREVPSTANLRAGQYTESRTFSVGKYAAWF